ncbi:MAG TPA: murein biosynthesis integral membrane protein MurJ [Candidatus Limnocylindrales bacterium]|nr:murein biosynthesis integral membrane protein MurJ [Candidatus Limnocylindrales bacterium]
MDEAVEATTPGEEARQAGTTRSLARAGIIVTLAFGISRILGYLRYVVIAAAVPNPSQLDAFFAAFRIPDFLFQLVAAGALSSAMIPVVAGLFATDASARAWRVVSTVTTLVLSALAVLAVLVLVFAPVLVPIITPGFDQAQLEMTIQLTRVMVLAPLFLAAGAVATSVLNARNRFGAAALAPIVYNLGIIVGALLFVPVFGVVGLAVGVVIGSIGHLLVQVPILRRIGARIRPRLDLKDADARKTLVLMAPRALGLGAVQVVFLVMTSLASTLTTGAIAAFTFAFAVLQIPIGVIGVPLGVVLLPSLSREAAIGDADAYRRLLVRALRLLAFVMVPIAALGFVVSGDITRLLFDYGSTDPRLLDTTSVALQAFLLGVTAHALIAVLARAFYARQDTLTPVVAALVAVGVDIAAAVVLVGQLGVVGLALAIAIGAWVETLILAGILGRRVEGLDLGSVVRVLVLTSVISLVAAAVAFGVQRWLAGVWGERPSQLLILVELVITTAAGGLVVVAGAAALRMEELRTIVGVMADLVRRRGRP